MIDGGIYEGPNGEKLHGSGREIQSPPEILWKMPEWMKSYEHLICNTGGNKVEDMVNGNADPLINLPLSTLQACVKSQVILLERLHRADHLK